MPCKVHQVYYKWKTKNVISINPLIHQQKDIEKNETFEDIAHARVRISLYEKILKISKEKKK